MWYEGEQTIKPKDRQINTIRGIDQFEDDEEAKTWFCEYLRNNLGVASKIITGNLFDPYPFQEILLNGMWDKDRFLGITGRGLGKSTIAGIFCCLYCIMNPGAKIVVLSITFRQARQILDEIDKLAKRLEAKILRDCLEDPSRPVSRAADIWKVDFKHGSEIVALPTGAGNKIRGRRANIVICDEFLGFDENIFKEVISPFLSTNIGNTRERTDIRELENKLIAEGKMTQKERMQFSNNKFIALSSATFQFEYLYSLYKDYISLISKGGEEDASYGICQFSYEMAPDGYYNEATILDAKEQMSKAQFDREYRAQFSEGSGGFFNIRTLKESKPAYGDSPFFELVGDPDAQYILSVDPAFGESAVNDNFAIAVYKIDNLKDRKIRQVHTYAVAGGKQKNHYFYICFLLKHFNIVYFILDSTGGGGDFWKGFQESVVYKEQNMNLGTFMSDFDEANYQQCLKDARKSYSKEANKIVHLQNFIAWTNTATYALQTAVEKNKIKFAGVPIDKDWEDLERQARKLPLDDLVFDGQEAQSKNGEGRSSDFLEKQRDLIDLTINETASIEPRTTESGQKFDLPQSAKRDKNPNRPRKDCYTTLLMANWAIMRYADMMQLNEGDFGNFDVTDIPWQ